MIQLFVKNWILPCLIIIFVSQSLSQENRTKPTGSAQREKIKELIDQLGHEDFSQREVARTKLLTIGVTAFDALYDARRHQDAEVRATIRWLLQNIQIQWNEDELPESLTATVRDYSNVNREQRALRLERIRTSEHWQRFILLSKIARFEQDQALAKQAAVDLIVSKFDHETTAQQNFDHQILESIGQSRRITCCWIRESIQLQNKRQKYFERWYALIEPEFGGQKNPGKLNQSTLRLIRWLGDEAIRLNDPISADKLAQLLVNNTRDELIDISETADWLVARSLWKPFQLLRNKYPETFDESPWLLFRVAESEWQQSEFEKARKVTDRAKSLISEGHTRRLEIALHLRRSGYSRIAFELLTTIIAESDEGSNVWVYGRLMAAEWLHDQQEDAKAVQTMLPLIKWLDTEEAAKQTEKPTFPRSPQNIKCRYYYFAAIEQRHAGNNEAARQHLITGLKENTDDSDLLIAVYRTTGIGDDWREIAQELVRQSLDSWNDEIAILNQQCDVETDIKVRKLQIRRLASKLNTWAWLSANTNGDVETALRYSKRSLQLRPGSPFYLDTLASCYRASGKIDQAIKYQRQAVHSAPDSKLMKARLEAYVRSRSNLAELPNR